MANTLIHEIYEFDKLINDINSSIKTLKVAPKILSKVSDKELTKLFDKMLYNSIIQLDLIISLKYLHVSSKLNNQLEENFYARLVSLNLFETINNLSNLFNKQSEEFLKAKGMNSLVNDINEIKKEIGKKQKKYNKILKPIRHNAIAHKDSNGFHLADIILSVNPSEIFEIGFFIFEKTFNIQMLYGKVIDEIRLQNK